MLTLQDCIALSELTPEEIEAIADDKHIPTIIAAELGSYLVHTAAGQKQIRAIIRDDIAQARAREDFHRAACLRSLLKRFIEEHAAPTAGRGTHPRRSA
jgi:hypothetical protein